jgi:tetratricopeptide (TPR) repeat protein
MHSTAILHIKNAMRTLNMANFVITIAFLLLLSCKSDGADAYFNMGYAYANKHDYDKAIEHYKKAIEFKPKTEVKPWLK